MQAVDLRSISLTVAFLLSLSLLSWQENRADFIYNLSIYGISFISYLILIRSERISHRQYIYLAIASHLIFLFSTPGLSNDFYRFIWDGELINIGINPYDFTPAELISTQNFSNNTYYQELYNGMSALSRKNYSCYPVMSQMYFAISGFFSDSVMINLITLRVLLSITYIFCYIYLLKILELLRLNIKRAWILFLNPLWIVETIGNLHFEGVMISFMVIGTYYLLDRKLFKGSAFLTAAIQVKLIPLILLPFFFRYLGNSKATFLYLLVMILLTTSSIILLDQNNILHFTESLLLYFRTFEFNSFFFHYYMEYGWWRYGWWRNKAYSYNLSNIVVFFIAVLSLYGDIGDPKKLLNRFMFAFTIYLMLSTTVHPWYVLPLLAYSIFTQYAFPILWSFLVFLSYSAYADAIIDDDTFRMLVAVEYLGVISMLMYEILFRKPLLPSWKL